MIIECEKCKSTFEIDADLLKPGVSKLRCSVCKNTFIAQPNDSELLDDKEVSDKFQETLALDSSAMTEQPSKEAENGVDEFDKLFDESFDDEQIETVTLDEESSEEQLQEPPEETTTEAQVEEDLPQQAEAPEVESRGAKSSKSKPLLIILLILIIILAGLFAVRQWAPHLIPDSLSSFRPPQKQATADLGVRRLLFKGVNGSFMESNRLGKMFIIKGTVVNNYPKARTSIQIKGSILDDQGIIIKEKTVYAGNILHQDQIKEMKIEELDKQLGNQTDPNDPQRKIEPDGSLSFMIIFENLPENMSELTVEAVKSIPAN